MHKFTENEIRLIGSQVINYLRKYKIMNELDDDKMASLLDVSKDEFQKMDQSGKDTYKPLIEAAELFTSWAKLTNILPGDLLNHLLNFKPLPSPDPDQISSQEERYEAKQKLYKWERRILSSFDIISISLRERFLTFCDESTRNGGDDLREVIKQVVENLEKSGKLVKKG